MEIELKQKKRAIRQYLGSAYSDERLAWLLAHARNEKLVYQSCCCLIGAATSDHALQGNADVNQPAAAHYHLARKFIGAKEAEQAYWELGYRGQPRALLSSDEMRRRRLIPMILSEVRRRERAKTAAVQQAAFATYDAASEQRDGIPEQRPGKS